MPTCRLLIHFDCQHRSLILGSPSLLLGTDSVEHLHEQYHTHLTAFLYFCLSLPYQRFLSLSLFCHCLSCLCRFAVSPPVQFTPSTESGGAAANTLLWTLDEEIKVVKGSTVSGKARICSLSVNPHNED